MMTTHHVDISIHMGDLKPRRPTSSSSELQVIVSNEQEIEDMLQTAHEKDKKVLDLSNIDFSSSDDLPILIADIIMSNDFLDFMHIDISKTFLSARGLDEFISAAKMCRKMESFIARENQLTKESANAITKLLCHEGNLMVLDLGLNELGDAGTAIIANMFSLTSLSLSDMAKREAESVSIFTLTVLDLSWNNIGDAGVLSLCRGFTQFALRSRSVNVQSALRILRLNGNKVGDKGAMILSQLLNRKPTDTTNQNNQSQIFQPQHLLNQSANALLSESFHQTSLNQSLNVSMSAMGNAKHDPYNKHIKEQQPLATSAKKFQFKLKELTLNDNHVGYRGMLALLGDPRDGSLTPLIKLKMGRCHVTSRSKYLSVFSQLAGSVCATGFHLQHVDLSFSDQSAMSFIEECFETETEAEAEGAEGAESKQSPMKIGVVFKSLVVALLLGVNGDATPSTVSAPNDMSMPALMVKHLHPTSVKKILIGSLHRKLFEHCVKKQQILLQFYEPSGTASKAHFAAKSSAIYYDILNLLDTMNVAAPYFGIPMISNVRKWIDQGKYENLSVGASDRVASNLVKAFLKEHSKLPLSGDLDRFTGYHDPTLLSPDNGQGNESFMLDDISIIQHKDDTLAQNPPLPGYPYPDNGGIYPHHTPNHASLPSSPSRYDGNSGNNGYNGYNGYNGSNGSNDYTGSQFACYDPGGQHKQGYSGQLPMASLAGEIEEMVYANKSNLASGNMTSSHFQRDLSTSHLHGYPTPHDNLPYAPSYINPLSQSFSYAPQSWGGGTNGALSVTPQMPGTSSVGGNYGTYGPAAQTGVYQHDAAFKGLTAFTPTVVADIIIGALDPYYALISDVSKKISMLEIRQSTFESQKNHRLLSTEYQVDSLELHRSAYSAYNYPKDATDASSTTTTDYASANTASKSADNGSTAEANSAYNSTYNTAYSTAYNTDNNTDNTNTAYNTAYSSGATTTDALSQKPTFSSGTYAPSSSASSSQSLSQSSSSQPQSSSSSQSSSQPQSSSSSSSQPQSSSSSSSREDREAQSSAFRNSNTSSPSAASAATSSFLSGPNKLLSSRSGDIIQGWSQKEDGRMLSTGLAGLLDLSMAPNRDLYLSRSTDLIEGNLIFPSPRSPSMYSDHNKERLSPYSKSDLSPRNNRSSISIASQGSADYRDSDSIVILGGRGLDTTTGDDHDPETKEEERFKQMMNSRKSARQQLLERLQRLKGDSRGKDTGGFDSSSTPKSAFTHITRSASSGSGSGDGSSGTGSGSGSGSNSRGIGSGSGSISKSRGTGSGSGRGSGSSSGGDDLDWDSRFNSLSIDDRDDRYHSDITAAAEFHASRDSFDTSHTSHPSHNGYGYKRDVASRDEAEIGSGYHEYEADTGGRKASSSTDINDYEYTDKDAYGRGRSTSRSRSSGQQTRGRQRDTSQASVYRSISRSPPPPPPPPLPVNNTSHGEEESGRSGNQRRDSTGSARSDLSSIAAKKEGHLTSNINSPSRRMKYMYNELKYGRYGRGSSSNSRSLAHGPVQAFNLYLGVNSEGSLMHRERRHFTPEKHTNSRNIIRPSG